MARLMPFMPLYQMGAYSVETANPNACQQHPLNPPPPGTQSNLINKGGKCAPCVCTPDHVGNENGQC